MSHTSESSESSSIEYSGSLGLLALELEGLG